jgi:hypothetical protein
MAAEEITEVKKKKDKPAADRVIDRWSRAASFI